MTAISASRLLGGMRSTTPSVGANESAISAPPRARRTDAAEPARCRVRQRTLRRTSFATVTISMPPIVAVDVACVFARHEHAAHAGLARGVHLFDDAADRPHVARNRQFARHARRPAAAASRVSALYSARKTASPADGPSMFPPPTTLTCRSKSSGSMPAVARTTVVALKTLSFAIEPAVSLKRTPPFAALARPEMRPLRSR